MASAPNFSIKSIKNTYFKFVEDLFDEAIQHLEKYTQDNVFCERSINAVILKSVTKNKRSLSTCFNRNNFYLSSPNDIICFVSRAIPIVFKDNFSEINVIALLTVVTYLAVLLHFHEQYDSIRTLANITATALEANKPKLIEDKIWMQLAHSDQSLSPDGEENLILLINELLLLINSLE